MATVIPQQTRAAGTYTYPATAVPNRFDNHRVTMTALISAADCGNPATTFNWQLEGTADPTGATGWYLLFSAEWSGGTDPRTGAARTPPSMTWGSGYPLPEMVRGSITTTTTFRWGLDVTTGND